MANTQGQFDGGVLLNTSIDTNGMEEGFKRIKDDMGSVAAEAQKAGNQISVAFSEVNVSKAVANATAQVKFLENQLESVTDDYKIAEQYGDDKSAERLAKKRTSLYDRLELARQKLANEIAAAAQKEAAAEEKAAQRATKAAQKEAAAKEKATKKQIAEATKGARRFGSRMREITSGALVFNLISAGLRNVTEYFGSALKSSDEFKQSVAKLKAALLTAFQPIYEYALPIIVTLIDMVTRVAQAIGHIFATLAGKSDAQMAKNAKELYEQANAIEETGSAAKKAQKYLAGFDEIQKISKTDTGDTSDIAPDFSAFETESYQNKLEEAIVLTSMAVLALGTILVFSGANIPLGIGMIALGVAGLYTEITTNWGAMKEVLQGQTGDIIAIGSVLLLVIGAILAFSGVGIPLGIGLIAAGAVGLVTTMVAKWDTMPKQIKSVISGILAILSASMLAVGVILCLSGVGLPLGLAVIAAGLAGSFAAWKLDDNPVTRFVKDMANGIISIINRVIEKINEMFHLKFDGLSFGGEWIIPPIDKKLFNIPPIPYLAQGAVIPPNAPFMAVLGDQKHGTNIEAPEDLIRRIVREESGANDGGLSELLEEVRRLRQTVEGIEVGDTTIGQAASRYNAKMAIIKGG